MKKTLIITTLLTSLSFGVTGNQASIADLKEAVYKLILLNERNTPRKQKVVYKPLTTKKSYLDKYIKQYVQKNRSLLPIK